MKKLILLLCLIGCNDHGTVAQSYAGHLSNGLLYYKDSRTELCFAGMYIGSNGTTITNVPCTPEVEKVAHSFKSVY